MYRYAWKTGLKTTYYLRALGATAIEKSTINKKDHNFVTPMSPVSAEARASYQPPTPGASAQAPSGVQAAGATTQAASTAPKGPTLSTGAQVCSILDPDCEACQ